MTVLARDVMTKDVIAIAGAASVADAARLMAERGVSGLMVLGPDGGLAGVITEGDLLRRAELGNEKRRSVWSRLFTPDRDMAAEFAKAHGRRVDEVMTRRVAAVLEDTPLPRIATLLDALDVKRLPVLRDGRVVGVVARRDVLRALAGALEPAAAGPAKSDADLTRALHRRLSAQPWIGIEQVAVAVRDGRVTASGMLSSESQRQAVLALLRETPGVAAIDDKALRVG